MVKRYQTTNYRNYRDPNYRTLSNIIGNPFFENFKPFWIRPKFSEPGPAQARPSLARTNPGPAQARPSPTFEYQHLNTLPVFVIGLGGGGLLKVHAPCEARIPINVSQNHASEWHHSPDASHSTFKCLVWN